MKKLLGAMLVFTALLIVPFIGKAKDSNPTVTFKAVLSSPIEVPENETFGVLNFRNNGYSINRMEYTTDLVLKGGELLPNGGIPYPTCEGNGIKFEGWDVDPFTFDYSELENDITFTAYFNNDNSEPVFISAIDEKGQQFPAFSNGEDSSSRPAWNVLMFFEKGYTLQESDKPDAGHWINSGVCAAERYWSSEFAGQKIEEPMQFTVTYWSTYRVNFSYMVDKDNWTSEEFVVFVGDDAIPPENIPEIPGLYFCGWDAPYTNIGGNGESSGVTFIKAVYRLHGDCNGDGIVNTGDAVEILKSVASLTELNEIQKVVSDANGDNEVNTGDAVLILKFAAKLISEL